MDGDRVTASPGCWTGDPHEGTVGVSTDARSTPKGHDAMNTGIHPSARAQDNLAVRTDVLDHLRDLTAWLQEHAELLTSIRTDANRNHVLTLHVEQAMQIQPAVKWLACHSGGDDTAIADELFDLVAHGPGFGWVAGDWWVEHGDFFVHVVRAFGCLDVAVVIPNELLP